MNHYANWTSNDISLDADLKPDVNFAFGREIDIHKSNGNTNANQNQFQMLNDRDMFNKFSNQNDGIDVSNGNFYDSYGMPIQGGSVSNNKKSLLSTPHIIENANNNLWTPSETTWDPNDMYAELETEMKNKNGHGSKSQSYPKTISRTSTGTGTSANPYDSMEGPGLSPGPRLNPDQVPVPVPAPACRIETDALNFEYELSKQKNKDIVIDVSSPFAIGYIWKALILLTKNPSTDKLIQLLKCNSKQILQTDMKTYADVFEDSGVLDVQFPMTPQEINSNLATKINEIYKVSVGHHDKSFTDSNDVKIFMRWNFILEIPFYYQPIILHDSLVDYNKFRTKFIELTDVPVYLMIDKKAQLACLEIPCSSNMILGFLYTTSRELPKTIPVEYICEYKSPCYLAKKLIIPKLSKNRKSNYSKHFREALSQTHLGEIVYGQMFPVNINTEISIGIQISQQVPKNKYEITGSIESIAINHRTFYYVKNKFIPNKILVDGIINY